MKPLSCQKGFAPVIILVIIAVLILVMIGTMAYPPLKTQVEKITNNLEPEKDLMESGSKAEKESDESDDEITKTDQIIKEDEEGKAEETGKKDDAEEKDEKPEGIADEPPIISTLKVLDFSKFFKPVTLLLTATLTPTPFVSSNVVSNISRIKIPLIKTSTPTPTSTPKPTPAPPKKAIVVTLDSVKVSLSGDYPKNGEFQIVSSVRSGSTEQVNAWPYKNWDEADEGNTLKINQPIFVLPKESMGDKLAIWITVVENDNLPSSAPGLIKKAADISNGSYSIYQDPAQLSPDDSYWKTIDKYTKWLDKLEFFGTTARVFTKSDNFGLGSQNKKTFTGNKHLAVATYTIREVTIPEKPLKVNITLKKVKAGESGDSGYSSLFSQAEAYIWMNVFDGYEDKKPHAITQRIPATGTYPLGDNETWDVKTGMFAKTVTGPIIYYEIGVWDYDGGSSNDDQLEIVSDTLFMADYKAGDVIKTSKDGDDGVDASATIEREIKFSAAD